MDLSRYTLSVLDVSTAHIPPHTGEALGNNPKVPTAGALWDHLSFAHWGNYGWILYVCSDQAGAAERAGHPELARLIQFADAQGFGYLRLDCDADVLPEAAGMPTFDWGSA